MAWYLLRCPADDASLFADIQCQLTWGGGGWGAGSTLLNDDLLEMVSSVENDISS